MQYQSMPIQVIVILNLASPFTQVRVNTYLGPIRNTTVDTLAI